MSPARIHQNGLVFVAYKRPEFFEKPFSYDELKNMIKLSKALTEALTTQDLRTYAKNIEDSTAKMPEQIFAEAFRKSAPVDTKSDDDKALNLAIEEIVSQL